MRILDNGIYRDATEEELLDRQQEAQTEEACLITPEERIEALEEAILELAEVVLNG